MLKILPGDYVGCFESWKIISRKSLCRCRASLLNEPFALLSSVESLSCDEEWEAPLWQRNVFLSGFLSNLPFSRTQRQYLKVRQVAFIDFPTILCTKKEEYSEGLKQGWLLLLSLRRQQCVWLAWSAMWTSDSSHTCPSTQTNAALMEVWTVVKPGAMATDILLWCGGVHEGRHSQRNVTSRESSVSLTSSGHQTHQWQHATTHAGDCETQ